MKILLELNEDNIRAIIAEWLNTNYNQDFRPEEINIQVKSKQNYKSEWETAEIRVNTQILRKTGGQF